MKTIQPSLALLLAASLVSIGSLALAAESTPSPKANSPTAQAPKPDPKKPAPAPVVTKPVTPKPTPAPKPEPKKPAPTPAPVVTKPVAPKPAPAPKPEPKKPTPTPAPVVTKPVVGGGFNSWSGTLPMPAPIVGLSPGVPLKAGRDVAVGERKAYYAGRTEAVITSGAGGAGASKSTASADIKLQADLNAQTIKGEMGRFSGANAAATGALNGMAVKLDASYDAKGVIAGKTMSQGVEVGKVRGLVTTTQALGNWTLLKNNMGVDASFKAARTPPPGK